MSKENTKKFLDDVSNNEGLKKTLLDSNAQAWVTSAKTAGYEITVDELADELIGTIRGMVQGELNDGSLDAVTGGAGAVMQRKMAPIAAPAVALKGAAVQAPGLKIPGKGAARW